MADVLTLELALGEQDARRRDRPGPRRPGHANRSRNSRPARTSASPRLAADHVPAGLAGFMPPRMLLNPSRAKPMPETPQARPWAATRVNLPGYAARPWAAADRVADPGRLAAAVPCPAGPGRVQPLVGVVRPAHLVVPRALILEIQRRVGLGKYWPKRTAAWSTCTLAVSRSDGSTAAQRVR